MLSLLNTMNMVPFGCTQGAGLLPPMPLPPAFDTFAENGVHGPCGFLAVKKSIVAAEVVGTCRRRAGWCRVAPCGVAVVLQWCSGWVPHGEAPPRHSCDDSREPFRAVAP